MENVVHNFIDAINDHRIERIMAMITDDHKLIDAHGNEVSGIENLKAAWIGYYQLFPDYKIEIELVISKGEVFAVFGTATGTYNGESRKIENRHWRLPAAWKVVINGDNVALWQVYADTKIPYDIIQQYRGGTKS